MTNKEFKTLPQYFGFMADRFRDPKEFETKIDMNPVIHRKGKDINLRDYVNEGFESSDLMTNLKKFGGIQQITKEQHFQILDNEILDGDFRDIIEINQKAKDLYMQLSAEDRRNQTAESIAKEFEKYKENNDKIRADNEEYNKQMEVKLNADK